jgi:hypothetical protein
MILDFRFWILDLFTWYLVPTPYVRGRHFCLGAMCNREPLTRLVRGPIIVGDIYAVWWYVG